MASPTPHRDDASRTPSQGRGPIRRRGPGRRALSDRTLRRRAPFVLESLEPRVAPAITTSFAANVLTLTFDSTIADSATLATDGTGNTITLTGATFDGAGAGPFASVAQLVLTQSGVGTATQSATFADSFPFSLSSSISSSGIETIAVNEDITAAGVTVSGAESITLTESLSTGTNPISLTASKTIFLDGANADLTTTSGDITLSANTAGSSTGNFVGIDVNAATVSSSSGSVSLTGQGGNDSGGSQYGVYLRGNGVVSGATTTVTGTGGTAGSGNRGVHVTGTNSAITSSGGVVTVNGSGGGGTGASGSFALGIAIARVFG